MPLDPINYMPEHQKTIMSGFNEGIQTGLLARQVAAQNEADRLNEQYKVDLQGAFANPTPESFAIMQAKYPTQATALKSSWDMLDTAQKKSDLQGAGQVYSALLADKPEVANQVLDTHIAALETAGKDATQLKSVKDLIEKDSKSATGYAGMIVSTLMGAKEFADTYKTQGEIAKSGAEVTKIKGEEKRAEELQPSKVKESEAKADSAAVAAKFAERDAVIDLEKKGWDIKKLKNDIGISKLNSQIAMINAQTAKESNGLKRQELGLKVRELNMQLDDKLREKVSGATQSYATVDNFLNTADRILSTPKSIVDGATGPINSRLPTMKDSSANLEALVTTMKSQAFMSQIAQFKGMGALSDAEGSKLGTSLQNLDMSQSGDQLLRNIKEAQRIMIKARHNIAVKTGIPEGVPDTPDAKVSPNEINSILLKYGVK